MSLPRALAIDDDGMVLDNIIARLEQIGHDCTGADSVSCARAILQSDHAFDYVILDLELPLDATSLPDKQHGLNLLTSINRIDAELPVVVITAHDHDSTDLPAEVMRHGRAVDYVRKPFPSPPSRHQTLEAAARQAYARRLEQQLARGRTVTPFTGGRLQFSPERVTLEGLSICGDEDSGMMRRILDRLRLARSDPHWHQVKGDALADAVGAADAGSVASSIGTWRRRMRQLLLEHCHQDCPLDGLIWSDQNGYAFSDLLTVHDDILVAVEVPAACPVAGLSSRQRAILASLRAGEVLTNRCLRQRYDISEKTAKRDLGVLRKRGLACFQGHGALGSWVAVDAVEAVPS